LCRLQGRWQGQLSGECFFPILFLFVVYLMMSVAQSIYRESSFYANSIYAVSLIHNFTPKKYFYAGCSITRWRVQDGRPIFHLRFNLKSHCSITHLNSHKNCRVSLKKESLDLCHFGICDGF
jgi:hypothetical protein